MESSAVGRVCDKNFGQVFAIYEKKIIRNKREEKERVKHTSSNSCI